MRNAFNSHKGTNYPYDRASKTEPSWYSNMNDSDMDYSEARGRRRACKAKGLKGKPFRDCLRGMRQADKGKSKSQLRKDASDRKKEWKGVKRDVKREWKKEGAGFYRKTWRGFAKVFPATIGMRQSFRLLLNLNVWDMSNKIYKLEQAAKKGNKRAQTYYQKLRTTWEGWGGDPDGMMKSVRAGQMKRPIIIRFKKKGGVHGSTDWDVFLAEDGEPFSQVEPVSTATVATATTTAAAASTPVIVSVASILTSVSAIVGVLAIPKDDMENIEEAAFEDIDTMRGLDSEQRNMLTAAMNDQIDEADEAEKIWGIPKVPFWIGVSVLGVAVISLGVWAALRKKK